MGNFSSTPAHSTNDYELVIKTSKELEYFLELEFKAQGKGLHEKINSLNNDCLPLALVKKMRYLATIRNKLIHERGFDSIPDRKVFISNFETSKEQLAKIIADRQKVKGTKEGCVIF